jgi:flagellar hook-associated protein 1 FlgK
MAPRELRVIDAATGQVGLYDAATGIEIATRTLDAGGSATLGGYSVTLTGVLADGDRFSLMPNTGGQGDGRGAERLTDLARRDTTTDRGGFAALYAEILGGVGAQVAAADLRLGTATTQKESADLAEAKLSGVDLDTEAARLLQQQQAYQANAQVLNIARQLFDTLINAL